MLNKDIPNIEGVQHSRGAIIGGITGGIIGFVIALLYKLSILFIPGFFTIFTITSIDPIIVGIILGIVAGIIIGALVTYGNSQKSSIEVISENIPYDADRDVKLQLREEQLKISKNKIQTGKVSMHKEVSNLEKNITVPVKREELVIEKTVFDPKSNNKSDAHTETTRIPISEERIEIHKQPVTLTEISVNRHGYKETKHVSETLKKEVPHISTNGDVKVVNKNSPNP